MRGSFDSIVRWWGKSNGHAHANGEHHVGINGNGHIKPVMMSCGPEESAESRPWLNQLDEAGIPRTLHYPTTTLGRIVDQAAERFGDNAAVVYNQQTWTYRELLERVNRLAGGLARLGVRTGDRVLMALPNCPEFVLTFFAVQKLGAILVNAGPLMGIDDLQRVITATKPRVMVGLDLLASKMIDAAKITPPEHFIWITLQSYQTLIRRMGYQIKLWQNRDRSSEAAPRANHTTLAKVMENAPARPPTVEPSPQTVAMLQPTSGTTGAVKLVELTHANLLSNATQLTAWMSARDGQESVLAVLPMFHVYGLMTGLINPITCFASITLMSRFDAEEVLRILTQQHPSVFPLVPAICDAMSNRIERTEPRPVITGLRICMSGAAPLPRDVAERFERLTGATVIEGYGLSETAPVTHANLPTKPRAGSIGLPMPDTCCQVVDLDEHSPHAVPVGEPGELLISGPQVMHRYYDNPEATAQALWTDPSGRVWLRTGDIAKMDEKGFFQIVDRRKDMIIHSGLKVYPAKVEKVLSSHPRVGDVAVIGQPHPAHTEEVIAVVALKSGDKDRNHTEQLANELRALCREHLASYEVPSRFVFKENIPRSILGKALKTILRDEMVGEPEPPPGGQPPKPAPVRSPEIKEKEAA